VGDTAEFSTGLLNPEFPVPSLVKGRVARRYNVYRNNVTVSLIGALEANFPVVRKLLGEEYFAGFARDFAQKFPPQSPLLFRYGAGFPAALEQDADLASYPYLGDVARLEMLWRESYHAADAGVLASEALASVPPEALFESRFLIHPATRLIQSRFAIEAIFAVHRPGCEGQISNPARPQSVLITRPVYDVEVRAISPEEFELFQALKNGQTLGSALDAAVDPDADFDLAGTLALLLSSGAFHAIQTLNEKKS
jgi:Putative DNA-binding domain